MLESIIIPISNISPQDKIGMFSLMDDYYENVSKEQFLSDLEKKDCVIMIKEQGLLCGFSTQVLLYRIVEGKNIRILFSGDTVIDKNHRNSFEKMNPNYPLGDELVCLAQFNEQNLKPFILKRLLSL